MVGNVGLFVGEQPLLSFVSQVIRHPQPDPTLARKATVGLWFKFALESMCGGINLSVNV